jgi:hypothetical protein
MRGRSGTLWAAVASLLLLSVPGICSAQQAAGGWPARPIGHVAAFAPGSIQGIVRDETGLPVGGATVSAVGWTTGVAVTDRNGRFDLQTLPPGPYLVRAHHRSYVAPRAQVVEVRSSARASSSIGLRRVGSAQLLTAGMDVPAPTPADEPLQTPVEATAAGGDDHGETAWRLRHTRRGILKETTLPDFLGMNDDRFERDILAALGSPVRLATSFFADTPFSGQVNLLTTGSFDTAQQLFTPDNLARGVAYIGLGAPTGSNGDWAIRGALSQADISSWILAGSYATRLPARHRYDVGMSYSTQRYDGGNPVVLRDVSDGSRNAGAVYAFDTFTITETLALTYGGRYAWYDYLDSRSLLSPRVEVTVTPARHLRVSAEMSRRSRAPGAEEFLPPAENGIWMPPLRTFSSLESNRPFEAERATQLSMAVERDIETSTISFSVYRQHVEDQLVTLFGAERPGAPSASTGHYFVGNVGDADAVGCSAAFRTTLAGRVSGSVAYSLTQVQMTPVDNLQHLVLLAPSTVRSIDRIQDVSTSFETTVPETATRVLVLYRVSNGFARPASGPGGPDRPGIDSRFDVQVRQSLPFLNFTSAKWEMLVAVRNFFREPVSHESVYDELLVVNPPTRVVGGVTMRF